MSLAERSVPFCRTKRLGRRAGLKTNTNKGNKRDEERYTETRQSARIAYAVWFSVRYAGDRCTGKGRIPLRDAQYACKASPERARPQTGARAGRTPRMDHAGCAYTFSRRLYRRRRGCRATGRDRGSARSAGAVPGGFYQFRERRAVVRGDSGKRKERKPMKDSSGEDQSKTGQQASLRPVPCS